MFTGRQLTLFFNLLYKALKYDTKAERICAFSKRLVHTSLHLSSSIICGVLFLLSEIISCHPEVNKEVEASMSVVFDPSKREPSVAFSEKVQLEKNLWELSLLAHHFHPSVSKFTADSSGGIYFKGDPLKDFSLTPFLDKFAFRNPKSLETLSKQIKGGIAARKSGLSTMTALPLNDPSYLKATEIAEDEKFFHQFFVERAKRDEIKGIVRGSGEGKDDSDLEDEALNATEADENDDFDGNTDSEEEAFVNDLAEKLMESSGHGKVNLDDEDPDMDDWSDFDDDSDDGDGSGCDEDAAAFDRTDGNEDAFMDAPSSDEDFEGGAIDTSNFDDDDDDDHFPMMLGDDEDFSDEEEEALPTKKKKKSESLYADADEYEKILEEELNAMGKSEEGNGSVNSSHRKKKKRKIK
jgi:ribosome biogenesis protein MAK21